jgi:YggT family protein
LNFFLNFISLFVDALTLAILASVIMSWVTMFAPESPIVESINGVLKQMTEPILGPLRRVVPPLGMFDLTPMVALILLQFVIKGYLIPLLFAA